jgi:hypothetical protein
MTTRLALVLAIVLTALPCLAQGLPAGEREAILRLAADRGLAADDAGALLRPVDDAGAKGLPVAPLVNKVREGLAKGVDPKRIDTVVRQLAGHLGTADALIRELNLTATGIALHPTDVPFEKLRAPEKNRVPAFVARAHADFQRLACPGQTFETLFADERHRSAAPYATDHRPVGQIMLGFLNAHRLLIDTRRAGVVQRQAVGFGDAARDLGEELRPCHPDGDRQPDALTDVPPQMLRDLDG